MKRNVNRERLKGSAPNGRLIVAYIRVSTDGQEEGGNGLDVQRQHIVAYATANGLTVDEWFQDVESGAKEERPGLQEIRRKVSEGEVGTILIYRLDRLARDERLYLNLCHEFEKRAKVISVSESFGEDFQGKLMRTIIAAFAGYERAVIASRLKGGRRESARKNGTFSGGHSVLGYRPVGRRGEPGKGVLQVVPREAEAVRIIFTMREEGATLQAIADRLNGEGFVTVRGSEFVPKQVHEVLKREPFYRSEGVLARSYEADRGAHEPILGGRV